MSFLRVYTSTSRGRISLARTRFCDAPGPGSYVCKGYLTKIPRRSLADVRIQASRSGPHKVTGAIELVDHDGQPVPVEGRSPAPSLRPSPQR